MRRSSPLLLPAVASLLGFGPALGVPITTITPNGLGTTVLPPASGIYNITGGTNPGNGSNLFHSFSTFNLGTGATADFNVSGNVTNILARVTGGPSSIDGTITSTIGAPTFTNGQINNVSSANLFLINPAGIMFTANAQVNLGGSFIASSANYVKFSDGSSFYGDINHPIQDAGLSAMPVSAFGFLPGAPSPISFADAQIMMPAGEGIHVIGGDISLSGATLLAPGGNLTLFSAAGGGEVPFSLTPSSTQYSTAATTVGTFGAISITNQSQAEIDGVGGGAMVIRGGKITVDNSYVTSGNTGGVAGGDISVQADQLTISGGGFIGTECEVGSTANAGSINVNVAGALDISGSGSQISANTDSSGNAGDVEVTAGTVDLDDGVISANVSRPASTGSGGTVMVNAGSMSMESDARVSSIADGPGNAGTIDLTLTGPLTLSDTAAIIANTYSSANGGNINLAAGPINMTGQTLISANTDLSSGHGGNITINSASLSIQGTGSEPSGSLGVTAQSLFGSGDAGVINVSAGNLSLAGGAVISSASLLASGNGGSVSVNCSQGELSGQSSISASSQQTNAGSVQIIASDSFTLSGESSVSTSAALNGGDVNLKVGSLVYLFDSEIVAYAGVVSIPGQMVGGNGGNINIDPEFVVLDNSLISANDLSGFGHDGNITNDADFFFTSDSLLHATGTIETTPPDLDLAGSLAFLPGNLVSEETQLRERCDRAANHEFSTFIVVGRGGIENAPEELQPDFGVNPHLAAPETGEGLR